MATNYTAEGKVIQYTCGSSEEVSSGDVVFVNGIPGIALVDIGNSETGSVAVTGAFEVDKHSDSDHGAEFKVGSVVFYDTGEGKASVAMGNRMLGYAYEAADKGDATVVVLLAGDSRDAPIPFKAAENIGDNKLVYIDGYDADKDIVEMKLAAVDSNFAAMYYVPEEVDSGDIGLAYRQYHQKGIDTDTGFSAVGDLVYLHESGGFTNAASTSDNQINQVVGVVTAYSETEGAILFFPGDSKAKAHSG